MCNPIVAVLTCALFSAGSASSAAPQAADAQVKEARKLIDSGSVDEAVNLLKTALSTAPDSFDAHVELGRALDLQGEHRAAREHFERAIKLASGDTRDQALTAMAISFAFEAKANEAARYYQRVFDAQMQANNRTGAAATANALGRIYLESGDLANAERWYRTGYETSKQFPQQSGATLALWDFRWHHALGRIAARKGRRPEALQHAEEARKVLEQAGLENQRQFYPYLLGYIALYTKHYDEAIKELEKGDPEDPFVLALLAQAHEKIGAAAKAREYYEQVIAITDHSINNAFARPPARRYLTRSRR
jgi:tetratricopeptide (TPR) repeat protein